MLFQQYYAVRANEVFHKDPVEYPKWVEINGESLIVQDEEDYRRRLKIHEDSENTGPDNIDHPEEEEIQPISAASRSRGRPPSSKK